MADRPTFLDPPATEPAQTESQPTEPAGQPTSLAPIGSVLSKLTQRDDAPRTSTTSESDSESLPEAYLDGQRKAKYVRWAYLDPTTTLEARFLQAQVRHHEAQSQFRPADTINRYRQAVVSAEESLADGRERDQAMLELRRPDGCWCFGLGGRDPAVVAVPPEAASLISQWEYRLEGKTANQPAAVHREETVMGVTCPYCSEGQEAAERKHAITEALQRGMAVLPERGWKNSGIPSGMLGWRLETSRVGESGDADAQARMGALLIRLAFCPPASFFFRGEVGRGKTGLAIGLAWRWREERVIPWVLFTSAPDLMAELKASYGRRDGDDGPNEEQVMQRYAQAPFLILDDLGREYWSGTPWLESIFYRLLGTRHANNRITIFTSNLPDAELSQRVGLAVMSRITEMTNPDRMVDVIGEDLRQAKAAAAPRRARR